MNKIISLALTTTVLMTLWTGIISCSDKDEPSPLTISSISPATGPHTTVVTIAGKGFIEGSTVVMFNGKTAQIHSITQQQIVVAVPKGAGSGPVTIQRGNASVEGPDFDYIQTITVTTLAGNSSYGFEDATGTSAKFWSPYGLTIDANGNLYIADTGNNRIRKVTSTGVVTTVAGSGEKGFLDGPAATAKFNSPNGITIDAAGNLFVSDSENNRIRKITPAGTVSTLSGTGENSFLDGPGASAKFSYPIGITIDAAGNLYVADSNNNRIRKITPAGTVTTIAGTGNGDYLDGIGINAMFAYPFGLAIDIRGNLYVADTHNARIRKIDPTGMVTTVAGSEEGYLDGPAASAKFRYPGGVTLDTEGNIYVSDTGDHRIRKISTTGEVSTIAGTGEFDFENGPGASAMFGWPSAMAFDMQGNLYVAEGGNSRIRKILIE